MRSSRPVVCALVMLLVGCGASADKRNPALADAAAIVSAGAIEVVLELDQPPGNLAVDDRERVYFTLHPEAHPSGTRLAIFDPSVPDLRAGMPTAGRFPPYELVPFPDEATQRVLRTPLGVRLDAKRRLWVIDHGAYGDDPPVLHAWDIDTRREVFRLEFDRDVGECGSMFNDLAVDAEREVVYIADPSAFEFDPAIVVVDLATKRARRVLVDHESVSSDDSHVVVRGRFLKVFGVPLRVDVDTIALSPDGEWLYFAPMTGRTLWRAPTSALRDEALDEDALAAKVERFGPKPTSDGGACGPDGVIYITAPEVDGIACLGLPGRERELVLLAKDERLCWPDGCATSPDGQWLYVACSELHEMLGADLDEAVPAHRPYRLLRIRLPGR